VPTPDAAAPTSIRPDPLEAGLAGIFAFDPEPSVFHRVDERVERAIRSWTPPSARLSGRARPRLRRRAGIAGLLAAVIVVGGAGGGLLGLYAWLSGPYSSLPWERGEELGISQVVDGYRVTIDRAYADATRLMLAISVVDELQRPGISQLMAMSTVVTDESGRYSGNGATSSPLDRTTAANMIWLTPAAIPLPAGPRRFHVVMPHIEVRDDATPPPESADVDGWNPWRSHLGPWTFDFELQVAGGTAAAPTAVAEVGGVRVSIARLVAAPSVVRVELEVEGAAGSDWSPIGEVRHGGRVLRFVTSSLGDGGPIELLTDAGVDDASGEWTVQVDELVGLNVAGTDEVRLAGPWILRFTLP